MLNSDDLDNLFGSGGGDRGFNDEVPDLEDSAKKAQKATANRSAFQFPDTKSTPVAASGDLVKEPHKKKLPEPGSQRPVIGAPPPPPPGTSLDKYAFEQAMDVEARAKGYKNYAEYGEYLQSQVAKDETPCEPETPLAPGIKKAPAYMPPGAYPGDKTKLGKEYDKENRQIEFCMDPWKDKVKISWIKQVEQRGCTRVSDGCMLTYRTDENGPTIEAEMGGLSMPWALEIAAKPMKVGDIRQVEAEDEHAFADDEEPKDGIKRSWRFELIAISGKPKDKFSLQTDERIDRANELRLRGNDMFKKNRLLRAMHYYEAGSSLMDVLEAEDLGMPGKVDKKAAETNQRIWQCQKPLALNWGLILMKKERWQEAERKFTEVLMDIDKLNVKALYRRGVCNINLFDLEPHRVDLLPQAMYDLRRAAEMDQDIVKDVAKQVEKVEKRQKEIDDREKDRGKTILDGYTYIGDERSVCGAPPAEKPAKAPGELLIERLAEHDRAAEQVDMDYTSIEYKRQREALYNSFLHAGPIVDQDDD